MHNELQDQTSSLADFNRMTRASRAVVWRF